MSPRAVIVGSARSCGTGAPACRFLGICLKPTARDDRPARPSQLSAIALLPLVLLLSCAAPRAEEPAPAFPVPVRPLGFDLSAPLPPVAVTGLDIITPDGRRLSPPLRLREDGVHTLRIFTRHTENAGSEPLVLSATLDSGGPVRTATAPVKCSADGLPIPVLELPLRLEPAQGSGESVLRINAARVGDAPAGAVKSWPLAVLPAFVEPVPARSVLDPHRVAEVFGEKAVLLDLRFRLGKGAAMEVPLPPALAGVPIRAVGVVSCVAWLPRQDRAKSGLALATVSIISPAGEETFALRLGVETLPVDDEASARDSAESSQDVRVFSEWTRGGTDKAQTKRNYAVSHALKTPQPLNSIRVRHAGAAGVVQVDGILVLPAE